MPLKFLVICEAKADFITATILAERVLCSGIDWLTDVLEHCPLWIGLNAEKPYLLWHEIPKLAAEANIKVPHGHFEDEPGEDDSRMVRRALRLLLESDVTFNGVILVRDDDRATNRRRGMDQARNESAIPSKIAIGLAHTKRECWVIAALEPNDATEILRFEELRRDLGFDPCSNPHELTAKDKHAKRSAKRVCEILTCGDHERENSAWRNISLDLLRARGSATGLSEFIADIEARLIPLFKQR